MNDVDIKALPNFLNSHFLYYAIYCGLAHVRSIMNWLHPVLSCSLLLVGRNSSKTLITYMSDRTRSPILMKVLSWVITRLSSNQYRTSSTCVGWDTTSDGGPHMTSLGPQIGGIENNVKETLNNACVKM